METNLYFNPGCGLSIYKPELEARILTVLNAHYGETKLHKICCHYNPKVEHGAHIINVCAGCDRRFRSLYEGVSTISLWEVLVGLDTFVYPNYQGLKVSVHDPCPVRERPQVHQAVRSLLSKMNIEVIEAEATGTRSVCCGDSFYPSLGVDAVHAQMKKRASAMPSEDVCVYCISCIKSMHIGGKRPRYLVDLLFGDATDPQLYDTVAWHEQLQEYMGRHCQ